MKFFFSRSVVNQIISSLILLLAFGVFLGNPDSAKATDADTLKIAYLMHLPKFVEWSDSRLGDAGSPFVIGVLGEDSFREKLEKAVTGKRFGGHPIEVRKVDPGLAVSQWETFHVIFLDTKHWNLWKSLSEMVSGKEILTVSDVKEFAEQGGMVALIQQGRKIQPAINLDVAKAAGVQITGKILLSAQIISSE